MRSREIKIKVIMASLITLILLSTTGVVCAQTPPSPANQYIKDVVVGSASDPLNYYNGGVRILLTSNGDSLGGSYSGASKLAGWAIQSWQSQTGKSWPYSWRSYTSVALEIQAHCLWPWIDPTTRYTTISFDDWNFD
jgi:hypothetical protein